MPDSIFWQFQNWLSIKIFFETDRQQLEMLLINFLESSIQSFVSEDQISNNTVEESINAQLYLYPSI